MATITGAHIGCSPTWGAGKRSDGTIAILFGLLFSPLPLRAQSRDGLRLVSAVEVDRVCVCVFVWLFVCAATWFVCLCARLCRAGGEGGSRQGTRAPRSSSAAPIGLCLDRRVVIVCYFKLSCVCDTAQ